MTTQEFQPTLPARGATAAAEKAGVTIEISTHAPRTGSDPPARSSQRFPRDFNPRSPHGERLAMLWTSVDGGQFQPTLPARGATPACKVFATVSS